MPRYEDDDRPRKRRPRDDEDEDDRPRKRRVRDDDEDDDRPSSARRRARRDEDDYDDRPRKKRKKKKQQPINPLAVTALSTGVLALVVSFTGCFWWFGGIMGLLGLGVGIFGFIGAHKNEDTPGKVLAGIGSLLNLAAIVVAVVALIQVVRAVKEIQKDFKEGIEQYEKEEAERKKELAKAAGEVQAAAAGGALQATAVQFWKAYDDDEDRFDAVYKNKVVELTGVVHEVSFTGETYTVLLKGGPDEEDTVDCNFAKSPEVRARLAQLQPGQTVRIRGKCLGEGPYLEGCVLVE